MDLRKEYEIKTLAEQLRLPDGELGIKVGETMNKGNRLMNLETISQLGIVDNDKILEIGMGNGFFVKDILAAGKNVKYSGCDFSDTMVKEASILNGSFAANAQFILSNADQLPFGDGSFDKVFTVNTIYFWGDAQRTFTEIQRVLKPDGILIVSLRPKSIMDKLPVVKFGFTTFSKEDIIKLIEENDYKMLSATESADIDLTIDEQTFKNSFLIIKAKKNKINAPA